MKKMFEQILGILLVILLLQGKIDGQSQGQAFNDGESLQLPASYNIGWMGNLKDSTTLSDITIPGTHDTMALYGGPAVDCQAWSLENQLKAGIRYLDFRVFALDNTLYLMHGIFYEFSTFTKALDAINTFLAEYPTETVLVRVKPELIDKSKVMGLVQTIIANNNNFWVNSAIPNLGEVRGKVVFVQKSSFTLGIAMTETDTKGDYEVTNINNKENEIVQHLSQASGECGESSVILTYSSGTGIGTFEGMFLTPKRVAEKVDPWLYQYLQNLYSNDPALCFGIIAMDFPGFDLIQEVIKFNVQPIYGF